MKRVVAILFVLLLIPVASWAPPSGGIGVGLPVRKLADMWDVIKPLSPTNGQGFVYSDTAAKWVPETLAGSAYTAGEGLDLTGTVFRVMDCADGEAIMNSNGSAWICTTITGGSGSSYSASTGLALVGTEFSFDGTLDEVSDPAASASFAFGNNSLLLKFDGPTSSGLEVDISGAFTGDGMHIHQHTGNPGAVDLLVIEADRLHKLPPRPPIL